MEVYQLFFALIAFLIIALINAVLAHMWQRFTNIKKIKQDAAVSQPIVVKTCLDIILHRLFYGHIDTESGDMVTNMVFGILPIIFITSPINYLIIKIAAKEFMKDIATSLADSYFHEYIRFLRPLMIESKQQQHKPDSVISVITREMMQLFLVRCSFLFQKMV